MLIMKKTKQALLSRQKNITIIFGYSLFALTIIELLLSTVIPLTGALFTPHVRALNVWVFMISMAAGVILPTLLSYILGDRATHVKNKASHHYNGVLFGITAYWVSLVFSVIGGYTVSPIRDLFPEVTLAAFVNAWPILATTIVMLFVASSYARHQNKKASVMEHTPYQVVLVGSIVAVFALGFINQLVTGYGDLIWNFIPIVILGIVVLISYASLGNRPSRRIRLTSAIVAATIGLVALTIATQLTAGIFYVGSTPVPVIASTAFGIVVWVAYLALIRKK